MYFARDKKDLPFNLQGATEQSWTGFSTFNSYENVAENLDRNFENWFSQLGYSEV